MKQKHHSFSDLSATSRWGLFFVGLIMMSLGITLMVQAQVGLGPWDVLHQGISLLTGMSIGIASIVVGLVIMLFWLPLGERPGIGTPLNILLVGFIIDGFMAIIPPLDQLPLPAALLLPSQVGFMLIGVILTGIGSALYIAGGLGTGPRDGVMMGLVRRTGLSIRLVRTLLELSALVLGWLLGGTVGIGTLAFAFGVGPVIQATFWLIQPRQKHLQEAQSTPSLGSLSHLEQTEGSPEQQAI